MIICGTAEHSTAERGPRGGALVTRAHGAAVRHVHPTEQTVAEPATPLHGETTSDVPYRVGYLQFAIAGAQSMKNLMNRVVVVTGGANGIGCGLAE